MFNKHPSKSFILFVLACLSLGIIIIIYVALKVIYILVWWIFIVQVVFYDYNDAQRNT